MKWLSKLFAAPNRRRSKRHVSPPLMAFYWDGEASKPHSVPDISQTGLFVRTPDRWYPRTLLRVTLQRPAADSEQADDTITLLCRVVRTGDDGVGMAIMLAGQDQSDSGASVGSLATPKQLKKFIEHVVKATTETPAAEGLHLEFSELGSITDPSSPNDQTAGHENAEPDETRWPEPDFPGPTSG